MFSLDRRQQLILLVVMAVVLFGAGYKYARWQGERMQTPAVERAVPAESSGKTGQDVVVHVGGAVEKPGVYHLPRGSRVNDAVLKAGALPDADLNAMNLAAVLADGQKITVPFRLPSSGTPGASGPGNASITSRAGDVVRPDSAANSLKSNSSPFAGSPQVNINTASRQELESLPGIGPALAERIIEYREKNGPFLTPEDIKNVSGIGEKKYEQLKDRIII